MKKKAYEELVRTFMNLPERLRVEPGEEFAQRHAHQQLALCGDHAHVFVGRLEVDHVVDRHQVDQRTLLRLHDAQRRRQGRERRRHRFQSQDQRGDLP